MLIKWLGKIIPEPNGCGPEGFQWAVPNLVFLPACNLHDNLFHIKSGVIKANTIFYSRMRWCIYRVSRPWYRVLFYELMALWYFFIVMIGGWLFYYIYHWKNQ